MTPIKKANEDELDLTSLKNNQQSKSIPNDFYEMIDDIQNPLATSTPKLVFPDESNMLKRVTAIPKLDLDSPKSEIPKVNGNSKDVDTEYVSKIKTTNNRQKLMNEKLAKSKNEGCIFRKILTKKPSKRQSWQDILFNNHTTVQLRLIRSTKERVGQVKPTKLKSNVDLQLKEPDYLVIKRKSNQNFNIDDDSDDNRVKVIKCCNTCTAPLMGKGSIETFCKHTYCRSCFQKYVKLGGRNCSTCGSSLSQIVVHSYQN